jgi:hypothetical protein
MSSEQVIKDLVVGCLNQARTRRKERGASVLRDHSFSEASMRLANLATTCGSDSPPYIPLI